MLRFHATLSAWPSYHFRRAGIDAGDIIEPGRADAEI